MRMGPLTVQSSCGAGYSGAMAKRETMLPDTLDKFDDFLWDARWDRGRSPMAFLVRTVRYVYALVRDFMSGQLTLRAMSLVYTTLLSLVPLLAVSFALLTAFNFHLRLEDLMVPFLEPLGGEQRAREITEKIIGFVDNTRSGALGTVGLVFFLYTVLSMIQKIEEAFNYVWQVSKPRSLGRRFSEYLSVLLVGPALMVTAITLIGSMQNHSLVQQLSQIQPFGHGIVLLGKMMPYIVVIVVFTFLYMFIPNTRVRFIAALFGGITAGFLWAATGAFFATFVSNSARNNQIYAGFAIGIVALIWLYLNWLILLIGAQLSYYRQHPETLRSGHVDIRLTNRARESLALGIMLIVARDFVTGSEGWNTNDLASELGLPAAALVPVLKRLEDASLLRITEDERFLPGRSLDRIGLEEIASAVRGTGEIKLDRGSRSLQPAVDVMHDLDAAIHERLEGRSLRDLVETAGPGETEGAEQPA